MKVLVYVNEEKDKDLSCLNSLQKALTKYGIEYDVVNEAETLFEKGYSAIFVVGGDGTILRRTEFANGNGIPIIGINAGKLGFLTEFEKYETELAVEKFVKGELVKDYRLTIEAEVKGKKYYALNDVVIQRTYVNRSGMIINTEFYIDGNLIGEITGDGVILSTPTGSTAYSLSVGGAILSPDINAFSFVPIAAHSLEQRPVVLSSESLCTIKYKGGCSAGVFIDGKFISELEVNEEIKVKKAEKSTVFLRRENFMFYSKLSEKLKSRAGKI